MKSLFIALCLMFAAAPIAHADPVSEVTKVVVSGDSSGSLNGKYFFAHDAVGRDYCLNIKVSGLSFYDPTPAGYISVTAEINQNASADDVMYAFNLTLTLQQMDRGTYDDLSGGPTDDNDDGILDYLMLWSNSDGPATDAADGNSGFSIQVLQQGAN